MSSSSIGHVFISYSRRDAEVTQRIVSFLRAQGNRVWLDNEKLIAGTPIWEEEIEKAIKAASAVVVLMSPDSKNSEWVRREISLADYYRKRIFPVLVRGDEDSAITLRLITRQYIDLRQNSDSGVESLGTALSFYLEELEIQKRKTQEEAERLNLQKAEEDRLAHLKAEANEAAKQSIETPRRTIWEERLAHEKAKAEQSIKGQVETPQINKEKTKNLVSKETHIEKIIQDEGPEKQKEFDRLSLYPRWITLFWITLGWSIGLTIVVMDLPSERKIWAYICGGAIIGFGLAISLRVERVVVPWKTVLWITLGWAVGGATAAIIVRVFGSKVNWAIIVATGTALAGFVTGVSLYLIHILSSWKSVLLVTLGWAISLIVGVVIGYALFFIQAFTTQWASGLLPSGMIDGAFSGASVGAVCGAVSGIIGGFTTAIILQIEGVLSSWKSTLWIALGWIVGMIIGGIISGAIVGAIFWLIYWANDAASMGAMSFVIAGTVSGFTAAITLRAQHLRSDRKSLFWIPLMWALAGAISFAIFGAILGASKWAPGSTILVAFLATTGGVIGGAVTIRQIRKEKTNNLPI